MKKSSYSFTYWLLGAFILLSSFISQPADAALHLVDRLQRAQIGDYIVTAVDNTYTALVVTEKHNHQMTIEEITIPAARLKRTGSPWRGWKQWIECGAPGNTSWVMYTIHCSTGQIKTFFSYTKNSWGNMSPAENFLSKLLNLRMVKVPLNERKKVGHKPPEGVPDNRPYWQPRVTFEGQEVYDAEFEAWRTRWPRDCTELSGKTITVFVPKDDKKYPSYFPYWLEVRGMLGKAKVRIIDSGKNLRSPRKTQQG